MSAADPDDNPERLLPTRPRWTHIALRVADIDATIGFYESFTPMRLLDRRTDPEGYAAWLGDPELADHPFILVAVQFFEGHDPWADTPTAALGPFNHLGIELPSKAAVDEIADRARSAGRLVAEPNRMPDPVGYICAVSDPDGNIVEFSYDQGVYELARTRWGATGTGITLP